ncbi:GNAT family N-acetyltransferase [Pseudochryseolinea flava]|nr:GNAT family N-acetyltransferase [Pseudochryseolinea flava]
MAFEIITYEKQYRPQFESLNLEWLEGNGLAEQLDRDMLSEPEKYILDPGGELFLVRVNNEIVGSAALLKEHDGIYELAKMCVAPSHRGRGIAQALVEHCMQRAAELKARKVILFSSHKLAAALKLYEKFGFKYVAVEDSPFVTADIKMELDMRGRGS